MGSSGHGPGGREPEVGFADAEGFCGLAATFVEVGEAFVGVAADEAFCDARLVEFYGAFGVAVLLGALGRLVAAHGGFEVFQGVVVGPDPVALFGVEAVERGGGLLGAYLPAKDGAQAP